jgi:hypothetical protein
MDITSWYSSNFEDRIRGRYVTLKHILPILNSYKKDFEITVAGYSELKQEIPLVKIGTGTQIVLGWSQMHGNESTTTKAVFDFLKFLSQSEHFQSQISAFKQEYTFFVLPMLNPDGAAAYTRENVNSVDLNRDALDLTQRESVLLRSIFDSVKPTLCLNLHDQRTIYGLESGQPATVSFLSPAANKKRTITSARKTSMQHIAKMNAVLQTYIPGQVGRYDDTFNENCVGDTFQTKEVPTILFEAGHSPGDYMREKTREYVFYALLSLFDITPSVQKPYTVADYEAIPQNNKYYKDVILRNVYIDKLVGVTDVAIQYQEEVSNEKINFIPIIEFIGNLSDHYGHEEREVAGKAILLNPQGNMYIGQRLLKKNDDKDTIDDYFSIK